MSTGIYVGVGGTARKVKKAYIGIGGTARKIMKGYIGVGGVARLFYTHVYDVELKSAPALGEGMIPAGSASIGSYGIYAGGYSTGSGGGTNCRSTVTAYNASLTKSNPTSLSLVKEEVANGANTTYAFFVGGFSSVTVSSVDLYNSVLTRTAGTALAAVTSSLVGARAGTSGVNVVFAGGSDSHGYALKTVYTYNESGTQSTATSLTNVTTNATGATIGNYALICGGSSGADNYTNYTTVTTYNASLTKSSAGDLSVKSSGDYAESNSSYTFIWCGTNVINAYNSSLTRNATTLTVSTVGGVARAGNLVLFAGGLISSTYYATVNAFDTSLTRTTKTNLSTARNGCKGVSAGNYALFAGGRENSSSYSTVVDAYLYD